MLAESGESVDWMGQGESEQVKTIVPPSEYPSLPSDTEENMTTTVPETEAHGRFC